VARNSSTISNNIGGVDSFVLFLCLALLGSGLLISEKVNISAKKLRDYLGGRQEEGTPRSTEPLTLYPSYYSATKLF
jgi:hypothetical protein